MNNLIIKFNTIDKLVTNSYSTLLVKIDDKKHFLPNSYSWINYQQEVKNLELEYICLSQKKDEDSIYIEYKGFIYEIKCDKKILIKDNDILKINFYINFTQLNFINDSIDTIDSSQILCYKQIKSENLPTIQCSIYNEKIIFSQWYNYNNRLFFYSKDNNNKYQATIQILQNRVLFYISTQFFPIKENIIYYSISHNNLQYNELNQIDCSQISFNFRSLNRITPILIAPNNYFDINNISQNLSITII